MGCSCLVLMLLGCAGEYELVGPPKFDLRVEVTTAVSFSNGKQSKTVTITSLTANGNKIELVGPVKSDKAHFDLPTRDHGVMKAEIPEGFPSVPAILMTKTQQASIAALGKKDDAPLPAATKQPAADGDTKPGVIRGKLIRGGDKKPASGEHLMLGRKGKGDPVKGSFDIEEQLRAVTESSGEFNFPGLKPGPYALFLESAASGYQAVRTANGPVTVDLAPGGEVDLKEVTLVPLPPPRTLVAKPDFKVMSGRISNFGPVVMGAMAGVRVCYARAYERNAKAAGTLTETLSIDEAGRVANVTSKATGKLDDQIVECVEQRLRTTSYQAAGAKATGRITIQLAAR